MDTPNLEPASTNQILDRALRLTRMNFVKLAKTVLVVVVPLQVLVFLLSISLVNSVDGSGSSKGSVGAIIALAVTVGIGSLLAQQIATGATIKINADTVLGRTSTSGESLNFAISRLGSLVWLGIISTLGMIVGFILCFIPGIYLYTMWAVAAPVLLLERKNGTGALKRSRELVKGRGWSTLATVVSAAILAAIVAAIISFPLHAILAFAPNGNTGTAFVNAVTNIITSAITVPFSAAVVVLVYFDLRVRKEAFDLQGLADSLDDRNNPGDATPNA